MATGNSVNANSTGLVRYNGTGTFDSVTTTNHSVLVGAASNGITNIALTNGQLAIGSTGVDPVAALPASSDVSIIITAGAGTLDFKTTVGQIPQSFSNLGMTYSAGTFTVNGATGAALSSTNPGFVSFQSVANPGRIITIAVTANQTFTDAAGSNQISGNNFGVTAAIAWNTDVPFFLYAVPNTAENQIAFMISRTPARNGAPVAGNIGQSGSALATTQGSFFSLLAITAANYAGNPCAIIGSFRMRKTTTANDWTVQALSQTNSNDGMGCFQEMITFTMPVTQNGAGTGKYLTENGGTAPVFTNQIVNYRLDRTGLVNVGYDLNGDGGTDGAGAVTAQLVVPYQVANLTGTDVPSGNDLITISAGLGTISINATTVTSQNYLQMGIFTGGALTNANFSNGNRLIQGTVRYFSSTG